MKIDDVILGFHLNSFHSAEGFEFFIFTIFTTVEIVVFQ